MTKYIVCNSGSLDKFKSELLGRIDELEGLHESTDIECNSAENLDQDYFDEYEHARKRNDPDYWWTILIENGVEEQTLQVVTDINGYSMKTLNDVSRAMFALDLNDLM